MLSFLVWVLLLMVCWPIALLALLVYPVVWLLLLPFRLLGIGVDAIFSLLKGIVMLPARVLGSGRAIDNVMARLSVGQLTDASSAIFYCEDARFHSKANIK